MREELLAFLLDDLNTEQRCQVEEHLREDPDWQQEYDRLRECLRNSVSEEEDPAELPGDLARRTCTLIENVEQDGSSDPMTSAQRIRAFEQTGFEHIGTFGQSGPITKSDTREAAPCAHAHRCSLIDLTIAFGTLAILAMLLLPALHRSREMARQLHCQNNLRAIGIALVDYAERHQQQLPSVAPHENAGIFALKLAEQSMIQPDRLAELLICPASPLANRISTGNAIVAHIPTRHQMLRSSGQARQIMRQQMAGSYAYRLGFYNRGIYQHVRFVGRSDEPMLADAPGPHADGFYSSHHGGCGYNMISHDLSLIFIPQYMGEWREDHPFLNTKGEQAAGSNRHDIVLGGSAVRPDGRTIFQQKTRSFGDRLIPIGN